MRKTVATQIVALLVMLALGGCWARPSRGDMVGTYIANVDRGTDTLVLMDSGTFKQTIVMREDGAVLENTGTWSFDEAERELILDEVIMIHDGYEAFDADTPDLSMRGVWFLSPRGRGDAVRIPINSDLGTAFEKVGEQNKSTGTRPDGEKRR